MIRTPILAILALAFALGTAAPVFADAEMALGDPAASDSSSADSSSSAAASSSGDDTCNQVSDVVLDSASRC